jgi:hypothetical protein
MRMYGGRDERIATHMCKRLHMYARAGRRPRARLHHGPQPHQVVALSATGQLYITAAGQIRLAVVIRSLSSFGR